MSSPAPFAPIAELLERSLSIRHVYGEPVHHGDTTVIPVAQVAYGFGAGGGQGPGRSRKGVVDENLAVHGVPTVHVMSSSVFVTPGQANSTFTVVVFAIRLVERLYGAA